MPVWRASSGISRRDFDKLLTVRSRLHFITSKDPA
jgi:hypothetical protein